jgi:hypothetical protein
MKTPFQAYNGDKNYVFVSYAHKDAADVYPAIEALNARGFRLWYDEGIEAGADWANAIGQSLEKASVVLAFLSKNFVASENCHREIAFAEKHGIPVVSVSIGDVELPDDLAKKLTVHQITNMTASATYGELADTLAPSLNRYDTNRGETFAYEDKKITLAKKKQAAKTGTILLTVLAFIAIVVGVLFVVFFKEVPDVVGMDTEIAESMLQSAGFRSTISLNYSEDYPFGVITDQSSTGKTFKFIPIVITQSIGSKEDLTDVPDTIGDHVSDGVSKMLTAGLSKFSLAEDNETNKGTEKQHIASQSIPAGLRISKNNAVSLGVATEDGTVTFERRIGTKRIAYKVYVGHPVVVTIDPETDEAVFEYEDGSVTVDKDGNVTVDPNGGNADEIAERLTVSGDLGGGPDDNNEQTGGETNTGGEENVQVANGGTDNNEQNGGGNGQTGSGGNNTQTAAGNETDTGGQTANNNEGGGANGSGQTGGDAQTGNGDMTTSITNINVANYEELTAALATLPPSVKTLTVLGGTPDSSEEERQSIEAVIEIPAGDTVTIPDGVELGGVGNVINNYGTMIITGSYESGMTTVNNYGTILVYGTYVGGMGETHNYGKFVVEPGGLLTLERGQQMYLESGSLTNDGAVYIGVGGNVQWKGGTLTNNGTVNVASNELYRTVNIDYAAYNGAGDLNMLSDEEYNALIDAMSAQADYELIPEKIE